VVGHDVEMLLTVHKGPFLKAEASTVRWVRPVEVAGRSQGYY